MTGRWSTDISDRDHLVARASNLVAKAIKNGDLAPLAGQPCADCGAPATCYDHRDYRQPLVVVPVCKGCNNRRGPGLPAITEKDGRVHKNEFEWSDVNGGGEGYEPLIAKLHVEVDTSVSFEHESIGMTFTNRGLPPSLKQLKWKDRAAYFKRRDPWCPT